MRKEIKSLREVERPSTQATECALLNSALHAPERMPSLLRIVKAEHFADDRNRIIWQYLVDCYHKGHAVSELTLHGLECVSDDYIVSNIIMASYTADMDEITRLGLRLGAEHCKQLMYDTSVAILEKINDNRDMAALLGEVKRLDQAADGTIRVEALPSMVDAANALAQDIGHGKVSRVPTGIKSLDYMLFGGFASGSLTILAARPSVGKTTIAVQLASHAARCGRKVLFISLEMTEKELAQRQIVGTGLVSPFEIVTREVNWDKYNEAVTRTASDNFLIDDKSRTLDEICHRVSIEARQGNCQVAFIDYLGLINHDDRRKTTAQLIGDITGAMKGLAKDCNIPVVLLCQLNRESAKENRHPQLHDLRDSGAIEQDADVVLMLERPRDESGETLERRIDMWLRKNRNGRTSADEPIQLEGNQFYTNFDEIENPF